MPDAPETFRPWFWLRNPHLQTILAVYWKGKGFPHASTRRRS
jgi:predicted alpha/beta-fold hydrolase